MNMILRGAHYYKLLPRVGGSRLVNNWIERYQNPFIPRIKHDEHVEEYNLWLDGYHHSLYPDGNYPDFYQPNNIPDGDYGVDDIYDSLNEYNSLY